MNRHVHRVSRRTTALLFVLITLLGGAPATAWAQQATPAAESTILASGSATVGPILEAVAEAFTAGTPEVSVIVERTDSGAGFEVFCAGESEIGMAGRTIRDEEAEICAAAGVEYLEFEVAFDGVAVVANPAVDFTDCLTTDQLKALWEPGSTVSTWQDLDPAWPADPIALYGTGESSGTYQYFTQAIVGEEGVSRDDYTVTEAHPETAEGIIGDANGLGFLPYPRYVEVQDQVKLLGVDAGQGCVAPDATTIQDGSYAPLSRKMYIYVNQQALERPEVGEFLRFYFADAAAFAGAGGLVPSAASVYEDNLTRLEDALSGGASASVAAQPPAFRSA